MEPDIWIYSSGHPLFFPFPIRITTIPPSVFPWSNTGPLTCHH